MEIYADNFRGFTNQTIQIKDVNFFVGENSTGKSSILSALTILESLESNHFAKFSNGFSDINFYSDATNNERPFILGHSRERKHGKATFLYEFAQIKGKPSLFSITFVYNDHICYSNIQGYGKRPALIRPIEFSDSFSFEKLSQHLHQLREEYQSIEHDEDEPTSLTIRRTNFMPMIFGTKLEFAEKVFIDNDQPYTGEFAFTKSFPDIVWLAPIRAEAKRIYEDIETQFSPTGEHIPGMIKTLADRKSKKRSRTEHLVNEFGKRSQLFESISVRKYGDESDSPFQLMVNMGETEVRITNTGYGLSQVLPIIMEVLHREEDTFFILMQPEVHLHPKAQAALGELIAGMADVEDKKFIIETHSDYLINRFRLTKKNFKINKTSSVTFFSRTKAFNKATQINIDEKGRYDSDQPKEFRDFFIQEELSLLEL